MNYDTIIPQTETEFNTQSRVLWLVPRFLEALPSGTNETRVGGT